ncbi:MAG TPA: EAL domain-containing protein, partial [Noviherbaspirillum sp.]
MLAGFLVMVAILTGVCTYGFLRVHEMNENLRDAAQGRSNKISLIEGMQSLTRSAIYEVFRSYTEQTQARPVARSALAGFHADFNFYRNSFVAMGVSPEEKQLLDQIATAADQAHELQTRVAQAESGDVAPPSLSTALLVYRSLETRLERLLEFERTRVFREVATASGNNQTAFRFVLILFCVALAVSVVVAAVVVRMVARSEKLLFQEKNLAEATLNSIGEGVITVGLDGCVGYINPVAEQLCGWHRLDARGKPLHEVYCLLKLDRSPLRHPAQTPSATVMRCSEPTHLLVSAAGKEYEIEDGASPMYDERGKVSGAVLIFRDVTAAQEMSRRLAWQAGHDALTGLANRLEFQTALESAIRSARAQEGRHALLHINLDRFKVVNDVCGHVAGDQLLRKIGLVIQDSLRETDMLARLGGDEFAVLLRSCNVEEAMDIARNIRNGIRDFRFVWQDRIFTVGASVGAVAVDQRTSEQAEVMRAADLACTAAKKGGSDRVRLYDPEHHAQERAVGMDMFAQIIHALDEDKFTLYRQKIAGLHEATGAHAKYEILLRMQEGERVLPPGAFLPVAERYGLMKSVDRWVISHAFAFLQRTGTEAAAEGVMHSINLSGATINDDEFLDFLREQTLRYQIHPEQVCFEVTETVAISSLSNAASFMHAAKELGFKFALDDFGTGMSSFAYLKHLPVDYVKIDGAFVCDMVNSRVDHEIVDSIVRVARSLQIE